MNFYACNKLAGKFFFLDFLYAAKYLLISICKYIGSIKIHLHIKTCAGRTRSAELNSGIYMQVVILEWVSGEIDQ